MKSHRFPGFLISRSTRGIALLLGCGLIMTACYPRPVSVLATIDVPAMESAGQFGTPVTLPGVSPTDQLLVSPTQYAGTWGVYYTKKNTVTVHYSNTTGARQDPPPLTFRVTYFRF